MENNNPRPVCPDGCGPLQECAPLARAYVPPQQPGSKVYTQRDALNQGTLFPGLNLPLRYAVKANCDASKGPLGELMALDFAIDELGLYLDTHADDKEALEMYLAYVEMSRECRAAYEAKYGPLQQTNVTKDGYTWLKNPWPWDCEKGSVK